MEPISRLRRWGPPAWVVLLSLAIMAPALMPGFVLSYDMVFTPRQDLLPASLGLGGGLPRAVPQDAVVAIAELVVPGELLQKVLLLAIPLLAGWGMLRLLRGAGVVASVVGATLAVWNPFVAERLVIGHWGFLMAYALAPWALTAALGVRRARPGADIALVLLIAGGSLTPSGSLFLTLLALPIAVGPRTGATVLARLGITAAVAACWLPWLLPALLHPQRASVDNDGSLVFALRDEGFGAVLTALGTGGMWNSEVVPASRTWVTAPVVTMVLAALLLAGLPAACRLLGRALVGWWLVCAAAGLAAAIASALLPGPWTALLAASPGGGLLRDAQKLLAPFALLLAAGAALGVSALLCRVRDPATRGALIAVAVLAPLAALPDLAWGAGARLQPVSYPADWGEVRQALESDPRAGDVAVLPWAAFRQFEWNAERTVLDPAPRWVPRSSVVAGSLAVATPGGVVVVSGDDPRARVIEEALDSGTALADVLPSLGVGWVLVEVGQRPAVPSGSLARLEPVLQGPLLSLYAVPVGPALQEPPRGAAAVVATDLAVVVLLSGIAGLGFVRRLRRRCAA